MGKKGSSYARLPTSLLSLAKSGPELVDAIAAYASAFMAAHAKDRTPEAGSSPEFKQFRSQEAEKRGIPMDGLLADCPELAMGAPLERLAWAMAGLGLPQSGWEATFGRYVEAALHVRRWGGPRIDVPSSVLKLLVSGEMPVAAFRIYVGALSLRIRPADSASDSASVPGRREFWLVSEGALAIRGSGQVRKNQIPGVDPLRRTDVQRGMRWLQVQGRDSGLVAFEVVNGQTRCRFSPLPMRADGESPCEVEVDESFAANVIPMPKRDRAPAKPRAEVGSALAEQVRLLKELWAAVSKEFLGQSRQPWGWQEVAAAKAFLKRFELDTDPDDVLVCLGMRRYFENWDKGFWGRNTDKYSEDEEKVQTFVHFCSVASSVIALEQKLEERGEVQPRENRAEA